MITIAPRSTFLAECIWPIFRVIILQLLLISGIVGGPVAILVFTLLVDRLHWLDIDFHGKTTETISPDGLILVALIFFTVNLILVLLAWRFLERKRLDDMLFVFSGEHWKPLAWGLLAGLGEVLLVFGILAALGGVRASWGMAKVPGYTIAMALGWILASSILGPILEEMLNRGYWFQNIRRGWGVIPAVLATSLLFGGLHLLNRNAAILGAINIALSAAAYVLGLLCLRSLWFPIGWHAAWNFAQFFIIGLPNSGISVSSLGLDGTTLLVSELAGPDWLSGGQFGMEASLIRTIILITVVAALVWLNQGQTQSMKRLPRLIQSPE